MIKDKLPVFLSKSSLVVMLLLVNDILFHNRNLLLAISESGITLAPTRKS